MVKIKLSELRQIIRETLEESHWDRERRRNTHWKAKNLFRLLPKNDREVDYFIPGVHDAGDVYTGLNLDPEFRVRINAARDPKSREQLFIDVRDRLAKATVPSEVIETVCKRLEEWLNVISR